MPPSSGFLRALVVVACAKIASALLVGLVALGAESHLWSSRLPLLLAHVVTFGGVGLFLVIAGRRDLRATLLGTMLVLVSSLFSDPVARTQSAGLAGAPFLSALFAAQVDAFIPWVLWSFVVWFPKREHQRLPETALRRLGAVSLAVGVLLAGANLLAFLVPPAWGWQSHLLALSRQSERSLYWPLQYVLCLAALAYLVSKRRLGLPEDRQRTSSLLWVLVAGTTPMVTWALLWSLFPSFDDILPLRRAGWLIYPPLLATPAGVAYTVISRRALDVRWIVRQAIRYTLARYSAIGLASAPILLLVVLAYQRRGEPVGGALFTPAVLALSLCSVAGMVLLQTREGILDRIDRRFFREAYDARRALGLLIERCRWVADPAELATVVRSSLISAFHAQAVWILLRRENSHAFVSPVEGVRPLPEEMPLVAALRRSEEHLDCDLESRELTGGLPLGDRHWLVDSAARYLIPLRDSHQSLIGVLAIGEKQSDRAYSRDDWHLLMGVAAAIEMSIGYHQLRDTAEEVRGTVARVVPSHARHCGACGLVHDSSTAVCTHCGTDLAEAPLPQVIGGKYLLQELIGVGGMGLVYRAVDLELDRVVALKTLPYVSPEESLRLRREARLMAIVSHPNLAQIHGVETWEGHPFLLVEYLPGGTLRSRLAEGPLSLRQAWSLGKAIGGALEAVHSAGVLHRDIKPNNIGYTRDGAPKLLDFGLARLVQGTLDLPTAHGGTSSGGPAQVDGSARSRSSTLARGTPLYMSPEALKGAAPSPSFDLWSLSLVLYEAVTGVHPLVGADHDVRDRIIAGPVPDIRAHLPGAPRAVAAFFKRALSAKPAERPRSARALVVLIGTLPIDLEPPGTSSSLAQTG
jgi:hypothetical protein